MQFVAGLTSELVDSIGADSTLKIITGPSSAFHYVIHMRSDAGHPAADPRVRQALQLGTDHQGLIDQVRPGLAVVGNGTPVGPAYGDYYLDQAPAYDPAQAKTLLAQAGFAGGLTITLYAQQALEVPAIATVWKEQMKAIGVTVDIQTLPPDVYYGEGDTSWLKVDFGITEWGARATPNTYFNAAYVTGAAYNESHWSDPEFDTLVAQINSELDRAKRADLYKQAQQILIERGPVIVPFFETAAAGASAKVQGVELAPDWSRTLFRAAYFIGEQGGRSTLRPAAPSPGSRPLLEPASPAAGRAGRHGDLCPLPVDGSFRAAHRALRLHRPRRDPDASRAPAWGIGWVPTTSGATSSAAFWWERATCSTWEGWALYWRPSSAPLWDCWLGT